MVEFLKEFASFLFQQKRYWMIPLVVILLLLSVFIIWSQGTVLAPFIYTLF